MSKNRESSAVQIWKQLLLMSPFGWKHAKVRSMKPPPSIKHKKDYKLFWISELLTRQTLYFSLKLRGSKGFLTLVKFGVGQVKKTELSILKSKRMSSKIRFLWVPKSLMMSGTIEHYTSSHSLTHSLTHSLSFNTQIAE